MILVKQPANIVPIRIHSSSKYMLVECVCNEVWKTEAVRTNRRLPRIKEMSIRKEGTQLPTKFHLHPAKLRKITCNDFIGVVCLNFTNTPFTFDYIRGKLILDWAIGTRNSIPERDGAKYNQYKVKGQVNPDKKDALDFYTLTLLLICIPAFINILRLEKNVLLDWGSNIRVCVFFNPTPEMSQK